MLARNISLVILALSLSISHLHAEQSLTLGAKLLGAGWNGDNGTGGSEFGSDKGGQFGVNISYKIGRFYTGLNLQRGKYEFTGNAPDKFIQPNLFVPDGRLSSSNVTIQQSDFDLLAGYYFWDQVSLFIDVKAVTNDWLDQSYSQTFVGLGLGISGYIPLNNRWTLFGSFGFIGGGDIKDNNDNKVGEGKSWALEAGTVYTINERHFINGGLKTREYDFEDLNSIKQSYNINALFIGYNYSFSL